MKPSLWTRNGFALSVLILLATPAQSARAADDSAAGTDFFEAKIRPVLVRHCYECHSKDAKDLAGNLLLDSRAGIRKGGDSGPAVTPKDVKASLLVDAIRYEGLEMPPEKPLPPDVVADFIKWIEMGAPDPRDGTVKSERQPAGTLWSLQPIQDPAPPELNNAAWVHNDVDRFILARLEEQNLQPAGDADRLQWLRRVSFDLTGLPPTPEAIESYLADNSLHADRRVVDRLLQSPHFGERWGRHWLDVVRYAESNGKDRDVLFPQAWKYRDYVIGAFNDDKPFDRFIAEQLAGDLLPAETSAERDQLRIATGFLAMTSKSFGGGEKFHLDIADDQIDVTTRAFLGLTVSCARCHDHKFDPIPSRDYYGLVGIFRSTETLYGAGPNGRVRGGDAITKNRLVLGGDPEEIIRRHKSHREKIDKLSKRQKSLEKKIKKLKGDSDTAALNAARQELEQVEEDLKAAKNEKFPPLELAMGVRESGKPEDYPLLIRGELNKKGDPASRGFVSVVPTRKEYPVPEDRSGRRQLANWITDTANPLTPRVAVNRIWLHLFGRGLVSTVDNFGVNGARPTHPELLDYLATEFIRQGWSTKRIIRLIVLSHAYRLSTQHDKQNYAADPDNNFAWRMSSRRLEAEAIRDAMLAASGLLDRTPPEGSPVAEIGDGEVGRGINTRPLERTFNHRSVYLPILRTRLQESLKLFDFAEPSIVVGKRAVTTVPAQALYLMNSDFVLAQAEATAKRILSAGDADLQDRIRLAYQLCLARLPRESEQTAAAEFLQEFQQQLAAEKADSKNTQPDLKAWSALCQALFATGEFRYIN